MRLMMGKILGYFEELGTWMPLAVPAALNAEARWVVSVSAIKTTISTDVSKYQGASVAVHEAHGQTPRGQPLADTTTLELYQWIYVRKTVTNQIRALEAPWPEAPSP